MPRFFETLWNWLKRRSLVKPIPGGELLVFAFAMGIINYFYQMEVIIILRYQSSMLLKNYNIYFYYLLGKCNQANLLSFIQKILGSQLIIFMIKGYVFFILLA